MIFALIGNLHCCRHHLLGRPYPATRLDGWAVDMGYHGLHRYIGYSTAESSSYLGVSCLPIQAYMRETSNIVRQPMDEVYSGRDSWFLRFRHGVPAAVSADSTYGWR